ncbi:NAD(P)/FAD-dependent oxidoreductase [Promethearchaeum syntrophicum]|uniref:NAD(P)/FAD-dependent oxidoreductase n=1 Tax=Promethearchaeum syntrophicum TaxID=2594042 RepID=A0A5B9D9N7_9ARCH|nr:FAD-dependent oxidoreductase [Candidatus Prometheoarchaeum syntrophicum]QEE15306.1 Coenzyme A disulfide reductase [Candidatus Prometheoarchaeum syntrophicum]
MKILIIGNGIAGQTVAEEIRKNNSDYEINIITKEPYLYYSRIFLPSYLIGEKSLDKLILHSIEWYKNRNISVELNKQIDQIDRVNKKLHVLEDDNWINYDKLVIASGSNARILHFGNPNLKGVFSLRNVADADTIRNYINKNNVKDVLVIGGGLLGIEIGFNLRDLQLNVTICEIAPYLLPRQLDRGTSKLLQKYLESKNLEILCDVAVEKILGDKRVTGIKLKNGMERKFDMIIQQMGIIPEISLAQKSDIQAEKGIIVNEYMQTNDPDIYAVGDCIQFNGRIWGIIPASREQSKLAAKHILKLNPEKYQGTFWNTRLKIAGINLTCLGSPEEEDKEETKLIESVDEEKFLCRKVRIEDNQIKSAILLGPGKDNFFVKNLGKEVDFDEVKKKVYE